jgi:hypothetical protein
MPSPQWPLLGYVCAGLIGLFGFLTFFGSALLNPWNLGWVMTGDNGQNQLAWMYFAQTPWSFPLGKIEGLPQGIVTNLIAADGLSLLSIPLKLILPQSVAVSIQFFGFWLCLCFVLQAVFAWRLLAYFLPSGSGRWAALVLVAFSPVMPFRQGHLALCGQWVLLAVLDALVRSSPQQGAMRWKSIAAFSLAALATHAYLGAMALGLTVLWMLSFLFFEKALRPRAVGYLVGYLVFALGSMWVLGYFEVTGSDHTEAFFYRADMLQVFASNKLSSFVPSIRTKFHSYDAFSYIGLGPALLLFFLIRRRRNVLSAAKARTDWPSLRAATLACAALGIYSWGPVVCLWGNEIFSLEWLYSPLWSLVLTFRATGRFIWPFHYGLLLAIGVLPFWVLSQRRASLVLWAALALQITELSPWWWRNAPGQNLHWNYLATLPEEFTVQGIERVALIAPYFPLHGKECSNAPRLQVDWYFAAGGFAAQHGMGINSASLGRTDEPEALAFCENELKSVEQALSLRTLYIVHPSSDKKILARFERSADCRTLRGVGICRAKPEMASLRSQ